MTETHRLGRRGEALRRAVLEATIEEIVTSGVDAAMVQAIARRAGVHETSIYRRWKTREYLILEALIDRARAELPAPDTGSLRDDLISVAQLAAAFVGSPAGLGLLRAVAQAPATAHEELHTFWEARRESLAIIVDRAKHRGELRPDADGHLIIETLIAPLHFRMLLSQEPIGPELPEQLTDLVLHGVGNH